ncbi:hypothetical protein VNI00_008118 [Paramarasmius palmivorus]|uniref:Uncharacterized protein n=1 Tax=Paramarasmius palmivorus TaxID=297713 RepID=A0AAW0CV71_9AGAR
MSPPDMYHFYGGWAFNVDDLFEWLLENNRYKRVINDIERDQLKERCQNLAARAVLFVRYIRRAFPKVYAKANISPIAYNDGRDCNAQLAVFILDHYAEDEEFNFDSRLPAVLRWEAGLGKIGLPIQNQGGFQTFLKGRNGLSMMPQ